MKELKNIFTGIECSFKETESTYVVDFKNLQEYSKGFSCKDEILKLNKPFKWYKLSGNYSLVIKI